MIRSKLFQGLRKKLKQELSDVVILSEDKAAKGAWVKSGIPGLDGVIGSAEHGIPLGRPIEIFGPESHGKSSLLYYLLGRVQKIGGAAFLIDSEDSFDPKWALKMGLDAGEDSFTRFVLGTEGCVEGFMDTVVMAGTEIRRRDRKMRIPILWGWDTIYCTPVHEQLDKKSYRDTRRLMGLSRAMAEHLPSFRSFLGRYQIGMIFINQVRDNTTGWGSDIRTPGGHAIKHLMFSRVCIKRSKMYPSGNIVSRAINIKNKMDRPFAEVLFKIDQRKGVMVADKPKRKK